MSIEALPATVTRLSARDYARGDAGDPRHVVVDLGESAGPPPPQEFVLEDYIPAGCVTSLYAKGGSSKSFLALILAFHVVRGVSVFDRAVQRGPVLYLDAELDQQTAERRGWMIANGLGLDRIPDGLKYVRLRGSLTESGCNADIRGIIQEHRPRLTIIDSFTAAIRGKDTNSLDDISDRLRWLDEFGTVLMIDHVSKSADFGANVSAIGSVAKQIFARSALFIASNGNASILRHEKSNFGPLSAPVRFALNFSSEFVALEAPLRDDDPRLQGIEGALPIRERLRSVMLNGEYPEGVSAQDLSELLEVSRSSVSNALTSLRSEGIVKPIAGKWYAEPRPSLPPVS
jgi:biotin operon repressor